jgi:cell division protease FtsH
VLLSGPPGTGKTLLARAVAGEADAPFFSLSASEFVEMVVGVGASRVRDLFKKAKEEAPAIIFIDELDAIGRHRGSGPQQAGSDEREQTLNQILTEMDGFTGAENVTVIAATNRPEVLDHALLRPGRFDRQVVVNAPDHDGRLRILEVHTRRVPLAKGVDLDTVASMATGMVGADLRNLVNEAALGAARRDRCAVELDDVTEAFERVVLGAERSITVSQEERERTAYHESGHALLGMLEPGADPVRKVSIVPRGYSLGVTLQSPDGDRYTLGSQYLLGRIVGLMGGRAAEEIIYGDITTGVESDLEQATRGRAAPADRRLRGPAASAHRRLHRSQWHRRANRSGRTRQHASRHAARRRAAHHPAGARQRAPARRGRAGDGDRPGGRRPPHGERRGRRHGLRRRGGARRGPEPRGPPPGSGGHARARPPAERPTSRHEPARRADGDHAAPACCSGPHALIS